MSRVNSSCNLKTQLFGHFTLSYKSSNMNLDNLDDLPEIVGVGWGLKRLSSPHSEDFEQSNKENCSNVIDNSLSPKIRSEMLNSMGKLSVNNDNAEPRKTRAREELRIVSQVRKHRHKVDKLKILVHGLNATFLPFRIDESNLHVEIQERMSRLGFPFQIQTHAWHSILRGNNLCIISGTRSGKTTAIVPALCSLLLEPDGIFNKLPGATNSPLIIVLTNNWIVSKHVYTSFNRFLNESTFKKFVWLAMQPINQGELEQRDCMPKVVITTPITLLNLLHMDIINLSRLCHFVVENIDVMFELYAEQFRHIMQMIDNVVSHRSGYNEVQFICTSVKWTSQLEQLIGNFEKFPTLIFGNGRQAAIYANAKFRIEYLESQLKCGYLLKILQTGDYRIQRSIVFCMKDDLPLMKRNLSRNGIPFDMTHEDLCESKMNDVHTAWNSTPNGKHFVLLTTDECFKLLTDGSLAQCLINYAFPANSTSFNIRLTSLLINFVSPFSSESKSAQSSRSIVTLVDETETMLFPELEAFFRQTGINIPVELINDCRIFHERRETNNIAHNVNFCKSFKFGGVCNNFYCQFRHRFSPKLDASKLCIEQKVRVLGRIVDCIAPNQFLIAFEKYFDETGTLKEFTNFKGLASNVIRSSHVSEPIGLVSVGQVAIYKHESDVFRCIVADCNMENVIIVGVDQDAKLQVESSLLFQEPEKVRAFPQSVFEVCLPNIMPPFKEPTWSNKMKCVVMNALNDKCWKNVICEIDVVRHTKSIAWATDLRLAHRHWPPKSLCAFLAANNWMEYADKNIHSITKALDDAGLH